MKIQASSIAEVLKLTADYMVVGCGVHDPHHPVPRRERSTSHELNERDGLEILRCMRNGARVAGMPAVLPPRCDVLGTSRCACRHPHSAGIHGLDEGSAHTDSRWPV